MKKGLICVLITSILFSIPNVARADEETVRQAQAKYREYQAKIEELESDVMSLDSSITDCVITIQDNNDRIKSLEEKINNSINTIKDLEEDIDKQEKIKGDRLRSLYKSGNVTLDYLTMFINLNGLQDFFDKIEAVSTLMSLDEKVIKTIEDNKVKIQEEKKSNENAKKDLVKLNKEVESSKKDLESKKLQQESIINSIEEEKRKFGTEVLEVAERELVQPQINNIKNNPSDLGILTSAVSQLTAMRNGQIQTDTIRSEIDSAISEANSLISTLRVQTSGATVSNPNRGDVSVTGQDIVNYAYQFLGAPYVWGATGPDTFDCSGFTSYVYRHCANLEITRTTYTQINVGTPVEYSDMQAGDLVFMRNNEHVGIYIGNGQMIHAPRTGDVVKVSNVFSFYAARRIL